MDAGAKKKIVTYSKKNPVASCPAAREKIGGKCSDLEVPKAASDPNMIAVQPISMSQRVDSVLSSLGSQMRRLSLIFSGTSTEQTPEQQVGKRKKSFLTKRRDGAKESIGLEELEALQTGPKDMDFEQWLAAKEADGYSLSKLAESTFSEVFTASDKEDNKMVVKMMPLAEKGKAANEEVFPIPVPLEAAFHEISALLSIRDAIKTVNRYAVPSGWTGFANLIEYPLLAGFRSNSFIGRFSIVDGPVPEKLAMACRAWARAHKSDNIDPAEHEAKRFAVVCMDEGGEPLEAKLKNLSTEQACSVVRQIATALAVLEREMLFEHRDLHLGNILVKETLLDHIEVPGMKTVRTEGVLCSIIDCSISRFTAPGRVCYRDLEAEEWIFEGDAKVDPQYEVYREMRTVTKQQWRAFHPLTNLLWLKFVVNALLKTQSSKKNKTAAYIALFDLCNRLCAEPQYADLRTLLKTDPFFT